MLQFLKVLWREMKLTDVVRFKFWKSKGLSWCEVVFIIAGARVYLKFSYDGESFAFYDGSMAPMDWNQMFRLFSDISRKEEPVSDIGLNSVGNTMGILTPDEVVQTVAGTSDNVESGGTPIVQHLAELYTAGALYDSSLLPNDPLMGVDSTIERKYRLTES